MGSGRAVSGGKTGGLRSFVAKGVPQDDIFLFWRGRQEAGSEERFLGSKTALGAGGMTRILFLRCKAGRGGLRWNAPEERVERRDGRALRNRPSQ